MITSDLLSHYFGGLIQFNKDVDLGKAKYLKDEYTHVSPAFLFLVASGQLGPNDFDLLLRSLDQLEHAEIIKLSEIVAPRDMFGKNQIRTVSKQGKGLSATIEVILAGSLADYTHSLVINSRFDMAITEVMKFPGVKPITTQKAVINQFKAVKWMLAKHLDVFDLIAKKSARGREVWGRDDYMKPEDFIR